MANMHELARGSERLLALIKFARDEGWHIERKASGCLLFTRAGSASFYTGSAVDRCTAKLSTAASEHDTKHNIRACEMQGDGHE